MEMYMIWILLMIVLATFDLLTGTLMTIWFAIGALVAFLLAMFGFDIYIQIIAFFVVSAILFYFTKPIAQRSLKNTLVKTNIDAITEKEGRMTKTVTELEYGEVKVEGKYWTAITENKETIEKGEIVEIVGVQGVKLIVKRREN